MVSAIGDGVRSASPSASFIVLMRPGASRQLLIKIGRLEAAWGNEPTTHPTINKPLQMNNITKTNLIEMKMRVS